MLSNLRSTFILYFTKSSFKVFGVDGMKGEIKIEPSSFEDNEIKNLDQLEENIGGAFKDINIAGERVLLLLGRDLLFNKDNLKEGIKISVGGRDIFTNEQYINLIKQLVIKLGGDLIAAIPISTIESLSKVKDIDDEMAEKLLSNLTLSQSINFISQDTSEVETKNIFFRHYSWKIFAFILMLYASLLVSLLLLWTRQTNLGALFNSNQNSTVKISTTGSHQATQSAQVASSSATASQARDKVSILVLNGTGVAGQAGKVKKLLLNLGYQNITTDNADNSNNQKTDVIFAKSIDKSVREEVVDSLKKMFVIVITNDSSSSAKYQVQITTGQEQE